MKTKMDQNSLEAFNESDFTLMQKKVFNTIQLTGVMTAKGVAYALNVPINRVQVG